MVQVSLNIRGGYIPQTENISKLKISCLIGINLAKLTVFPRYSRFLRQQITKTANAKTAKKRGLPVFNRDNITSFEESTSFVFNHG